MIEEENLIGHFSYFGDKLNPIREISFREDSHICRMSLFENDSKLLITDYKRNLLHLCDLEGNKLKSFNPNNILKYPTGVCVLKSDDSNEERIFVGDSELHKIFVFDSFFDLQFQYWDENLKDPDYIRIDNEFDKSRLYVSDCDNHELTIWNTNNGTFVNKIVVENPVQINFTLNSLFVCSPVYEAKQINNKVIRISEGGNCIIEIDKESLELKRRIIGNWYSPQLLNIQSNGNLQISAYRFDNNLVVPEMRYFLTIDQKGKIIKIVELNEMKGFVDLILVNNRIIGSRFNKLNIFKFE
jgi:hypothetical protein